MKKITSIILTVCIVVSTIPCVFAVNEEREDKIHKIKKLPDGNATIEYIPSEELRNDIEVDDDTPYINTREEHTEDDISLAAVSNNHSTIWNEIMSKQFGDEYFRPYSLKNGESVDDYTNKLRIRETDLSLPGRNGLDLNIRRVYNNQKYWTNYAASKTSAFKFPAVFRLYKFNSSGGKTLNIAFHNDDEFQKYMSKPIYVSDDNFSTYTRNDKTFVLFHDVYQRKSDSGIKLTYDSTTSPGRVTYNEDSVYDMVNITVNETMYPIAKQWEYDFPYVSMLTDSFEKDSDSTYVSRIREYSGIFKDIDGVVHTYTANARLKEYRGIYADRPSEFDMTFYPDNNDNFKYNMYYVSRETDSGTVYNMKIFDEFEGITYYLYAEPVFGGMPKARIREIVDDYNNSIRFSYDEKSNLIGVVDSYGREISLSRSGISYHDEASGTDRTVMYRSESLPADSLKNDSVWKNNLVEKLTVTNENGEETVYEGRYSKGYSAMINNAATKLYNGLDSYIDRATYEKLIFDTFEGLNIEKITYPTGTEKHYKYTDLYDLSTKTRIASMIYGVSEEMERNDDKIINKESYNVINNTSLQITRDTDGRVIEKDFYSDNALKCVRINGSYSSSLVKETYSYDNNNNLTGVYKYVDNVGDGTSYKYDYFKRIEEEVSGNYKKIYRYADDNRSKIPTMISYYKKYGGYKYSFDYDVKYTRTENNLKIASSTVVKDNKEIAKQHMSMMKQER